MTQPLGEGIEGYIDPSWLLTPEPTTELLEPTSAPAELLEFVRVNTEGRCLEAATPLGTIAVEVYWQASTSPDADHVRTDFFPALDPSFDRDAESNPIATQEYPYTLLPDGALYEIVVRAPLGVVDTELSPARTQVISLNHMSFLTGTSLTEFRSAYPGVEVDLPDGRYSITATEQSQSALVVAARVENGEPLSHMQEHRGDAIHYRETVAGDFMRSGLRPDTAVLTLDHRLVYRGKKKADSQRLEFKTHDGFQRTGEDAAQNSGLVDIVVLQGETVHYSDFTFTPFVDRAIPPAWLADSGGGDMFTTRGGSFGGGETLKSFGGLTGGETRYRAPETVSVSMAYIRDMRAVAAFRFAMAGSNEAIHAEQ